MMRAVIIAALVAAPGASAAQSFDEAVRANVALATSICTTVMLSHGLPNAAFQAAGFAYRRTDRGVNEYGVHRGFGHYFDAPADTAKAEVNSPDTPAGICTVYSTHIAEAEMGALVSSVLQAGFPGTRQQSPGQWLVTQGSDLPLIVGVSTIGANHRYEQPGTTQVSMSFPG